MYKEIRILHAKTLNQACTDHNWLDKATIQQRNAVMEMLFDDDGCPVPLDADSIEEIALEIVNLSSNIRCTIQSLMSAIAKLCDTYFEDVFAEPQPKEEAPLSENILEKLIGDCEFSPEEVETLSKGEILDSLLNYEGIIGYTDKILDWVCEIWNIEL